MMTTQGVPATRKRRSTRLLSLLALSVIGLVTFIETEPASAQAGSLRIDVRRGIDGITRAYSPNPLTVVVQSETFFSGWIEVVAPDSSQSPARYRQAIELPAASRKTITMVTPRSTIHSVRAVEADGDVRARAVLPGENVLRKGEPLIGMLSQDPPRVASVDVPILDEPARVVPVDPAFLSLGWGGITALSHLVVDGALLDALSPAQKDSIAGFAAGGGEVIVAAADAATLEAIAGGLEGGTGSVRYARVGDGRLTATSLPLSHDAWSAGGSLWERTVRPVDITRWTEGTGRRQSLGQALRETGGFRRPTLGWLLFFVLAYVAFVGPVNFMVLSRLRRRELAWLTIPGLSVIFAIGAYVVGLGYRDIPDLQGVALRVLGDGGEIDEIALGVIPRRGSDATVRLAGAWTAEPYATVSRGAEGQQVDFGRDSITARFKLTSGEIGTLVGSRSIRGGRHTAGAVALETNRFIGSVTNPLGSTLRSPRIFVGPASIALGDDLRAGDSRRVELDIFNTEGSALANPGFGDGFGEFVPFEAVALAEPPSLYRRAGTVAGLGRPGAAYLTGWIPLAEAGDALGVGAAKGNTLVLIPVTVDVDGSAAPAQAVHSTIVATDGEVSDEGFGGGPVGVIQNGRRTVIRFQLPEGASPGRVRVRSDGPNPWGGNLKFVRRPIAAENPDARKARELELGAQRKGAVPDGDEPVFEPVAPDVAPVEPGLNAQAYDFTSGRWVNVVPRKDGSLIIRRDRGRRFFTDDGEIYFRMLSDFGQFIAPSMFTLEGVSA